MRRDLKKEEKDRMKWRREKEYMSMRRRKGGSIKGGGRKGS